LSSVASMILFPSPDLRVDSSTTTFSMTAYGGADLVRFGMTLS